MPIKTQNSLPAKGILENENINEKSYSNENINDIEVLEDDEEII